MNPSASSRPFLLVRYAAVKRHCDKPSVCAQAEAGRALAWLRPGVGRISHTVTSECPFRPAAGPRAANRVTLKAAVEQRRRKDAKAENEAFLARSPGPEPFTWRVRPRPLRNGRFFALSFASSRLRCSRPMAAFRMTGLARASSGHPHGMLSIILPYHLHSSSILPQWLLRF